MPWLPPIILGVFFLFVPDGALAQACGDDVCKDLNFYHPGAEPDCSALRCAAVCSSADKKEKEKEGSEQIANRIVFASIYPYPHAQSIATKYYSSNSASPPNDAELQTFDQFWFFSYNRGGCSGSELAWAEAAARWFVEKKSKSGRLELMLDGRTISSSRYGNTPENINFFENIRANFASRGGGLFLGADDQPNPPKKTSCVNYVAAKLDVGLFHGNSPGPRAIVDFENPLMSLPQDATYALSTNAVQSINGKKYDRYINDHSSTSTVAANLQASGIFLCPVAFHGRNINEPAVSSTICGSLSLQINIESPDCASCIKRGDNSAVAVVAVETLGPYSWQWRMKAAGSTAWKTLSSVEVDSGKSSTATMPASLFETSAERFVIETVCRDSQTPAVESRSSIAILKCDTDCVSKYTSWSICNKTTGERTQGVEIITPQAGSGSPCLSPRSGGGKWSEWTAWGGGNWKVNSAMVRHPQSHVHDPSWARLCHLMKDHVRGKKKLGHVTMVSSFVTLHARQWRWTQRRIMSWR